jgi:hypothetical protein
MKFARKSLNSRLLLSWHLKFAVAAAVTTHYPLPPPPQVELLKAVGAKQADAEDQAAGEEVEAPCHQNMLASWFFGTYCELPTFDDPLKDPSKYKQVAAAGGDRRRSRSLLAHAMQRLW